MAEESSIKKKSLSKELEEIKESIGFEEKKKRLLEIEKEMASPYFWQNKEKSSQTSKEYSLLRQELAKISDLEKKLAKGEDIEKELLELKFLLTPFGKYGKSKALLSIYAGAGGVDAQDWAFMLLRMYLRFCEKKSWETEIIDESRGSEGGIKSVTLEIKEPGAYKILYRENGVHRLVRISPFDAEHMRHTSFAKVEVLPEIQPEEVEIKPEDLKIETFRAKGHGGQNVQKLETAVRITHLPTGIVVKVQSERSQYRNKELALAILRSKILVEQEQEREKNVSQLKGPYKEIAWGNQVRSYVLHPYKMVKDHRTGKQTQDVEAVLDGDLEKIWA